MLSKSCTKCKEEKPLDQFTKDKRRIDGRGSSCVLCHRERNRKYIHSEKGRATRKAHAEANKEANKERHAKYYQANKERLDEARRKHYYENHEYYLVQMRERYAKNKEKYRPAKDRWTEENRERMKEWGRQRMADTRAWIAEKKTNPCVDCGNTFPPEAMDFDHVRGEKIACIGHMHNHSRERIQTEIDKCDLRCANCHRVKTQERKQNGQQEGTPKYIEFREKMNKYKANPCTDCGDCFPPVAMDFDHVHGEKVKEVSAMWSWSFDKVLIELDKCELVCANCHRTRTKHRLKNMEIG